MESKNSELFEELKRKIVSETSTQTKKREIMPSVFEQNPHPDFEKDSVPQKTEAHGKEPQDWWWASEELLAKLKKIADSEREQAELDCVMSLLRIIGLTKIPQGVANFDEAVTYTVGKIRESVRTEEHAQAKNEVLKELVESLGTKKR